MQAIRQTQQLNKRELENAIPPSASWHADYRDTAWIYVGGLPFDLTEGDVLIIFSQFGNPTHLNMIRDKETGKSKGFGFLKYEDQRSCDLAVDNLTGAEVLGKLLRVDHTRYKKRDDEDEDTYRIDRLEAEAAAEKSGKRASDTDESEDEKRRRKRRRPRLEDTERLTIKERGEADDAVKRYEDEDSDEAQARERRRERKHKHRHSHRDNARDDEVRQAPNKNERSRKENTKYKRDDRDERSQLKDDDTDVEYRSRRKKSYVDKDAENKKPRHKHRRSRSDSRERRPHARLDSDAEHSYRPAGIGKTRREETSR